MTTIDDFLLARVRGAYAYGLWTTWGNKTAGQPAPPLGSPHGILYTFWGRPGADAVIVRGPGQ